MSSEHAASSAVVATCAEGGTLTVLVSTDTILTTLPWVTKTLFKVFEYTITESDGIGLTTSKDVLTVPVRSTPIGTKFEPVTYTRCIGEVLMVPTASMGPSSPMVSTSTTTTMPSGASPGPQPGDNKTLLIPATIGSISLVFILGTALAFWMRHRNRRKKLELVSRKDLTEAAGYSLFPGGGTNKKFSIGTTIDGTASINPTLVDYVGLMPSISQRNLVGPATDVQSAVDTDWSNVRRSSIARPPERVHGINSRYLRSNRVSTRPSQNRHPYTVNHNSSYTRDGSRVVSEMPTAESYTSRGTSAFLQPTGEVRAQNRGISYGASQEHILLPTVYSPDSASSAVPIQERGDERPPSQQNPGNHPPHSPSREWAWAEALRRLEGIHESRPADFTRDPTGDSQTTMIQNEFDGQHDEGSAMSEGDYETIIYESEGERSMRGPEGDNTNESAFSVDAVVRRIANEPPSKRVRR
ncbi:hypothetical protein V498_02457 [Pseudogymnoascus sp. VKM F-4517 (FW-2822)]|nr:hypothetical protein V498_02457 [Pseudogymnoascus sp. VKM F-4517 (FW-2822)]